MAKEGPGQLTLAGVSISAAVIAVETCSGWRTGGTEAPRTIVAPRGGAHRGKRLPRQLGAHAAKSAALPDSLARVIIGEAIALERSRPDLTALQILDLVMRGRRGTSPDFGVLAFPGPLDPSSPFGALLSQAFDEQVTYSGVRSAAGGGPNAFEEYWLERVMRAFSVRYGLHKPL